MLIARRSFLSGILALGCGPAIVRAASIMPVKVMPQYLVDTTAGIPTITFPAAAGGGSIFLPAAPCVGDTITLNGVLLIFDPMPIPEIVPAPIFVGEAWRPLVLRKA